jgi:hypothetical protein
MLAKCITVSIMLLSALILPSPCRSEEKECFCYRHEVSRNVLFNCRKEQFPNDAWPRVYCYDKDNNITDVKFVDPATNDSDFYKKPTGGWTFIEAGKTGCDPCEGKPGSDFPIKGDSKKESGHE